MTPYYPPSQQEQDMAELVEKRIRKELHKLRDDRSKIGVLNSATLEEVRDFMSGYSSVLSGPKLEEQKQEFKLLMQVFMAGVLDAIDRNGKGEVMDKGLSELHKRDKLMEYGEIDETGLDLDASRTIATEVVKIFDAYDVSRTHAQV